MLKRNLWKLVLSFAIVLWAVLSLVPVTDRDVPTYIAGRVETKESEFQALLKDARERYEAKQAVSVFVALRDIANERKIDLAREYFPRVKMDPSLTNVVKKNTALLKHLLAESKGRLQLGLDLKGGVAVTLAVDEAETANVGEHERNEKLGKAIEIIGDRIDGFGIAEPIIRPVGANRIEVQMPGVNPRDTPEVLDVIKKPARLTFHLVHPTMRPETTPPGSEPAGYEVKTMDYEGRDGRTQTFTYFIKRLWEMDGRNITNAYATVDEFGRYRVILRFNSAGEREFAETTRRVAQIGRENGVDALLAIVLDGRLYSAPRVEKEITGGSAEITGQFSALEAQELANVLNNPLDVSLRVEEQYEVGPSLASDSVQSGKRAFIIGTAITAAFIVVFYTSGGFLAVLAMMLNVLILLGVMAAFGATLSMPGIAGIVLTIGMSVDSNILIFERMREELRLGKSLPAALEAGFDKAFSAILDGNLTTLITAVIMIVLGTGPVKGFGVTLAIGIFTTMFAALVISRLFLDMAINGGLVKKMPMFSVLENTRLDFLKYARPAFVIAGAIIVAGAVVAFQRGDSVYGIDFKGGDQVTIAFEKKLALEDVRKAAASQGIDDLAMSYTRTLGSDQEVLRVVTPFDQAKVLVKALQEAHPDAGLSLVGESRIGPSVGAEIRSNAAWAIFWSLVLILVYVAFRFEIGYGVGAVVSTVHDILLTIGIFIMLGGQFNGPMVAAILLIVGYSINDTIVVFDRIREELRIDPTSKLRDIVNKSLNLTLSRTIITGGTTFLTAIVLATVGGGEIKDIAVTLIIGVLVGTFSSLYIASPVFYWWHKGDRRHVESGHDVKPVYDWDVGSKISGAKPVEK
jgi:protein-export membrane protein, SecD/SecF family